MQKEQMLLKTSALSISGLSASYNFISSSLLEKNLNSVIW
jgi:hypothetical protein